MHMATTFYWSPDIGDFFFNGLTVNGAGSFSVLCVVLALCSIVYEAMKVHSAKVRARAARERLRASSCAPSETANLLANDQHATAARMCSRRTFFMLGEAIVFLLHNTLGYALMLSVMIFNGYLFLVVVLGMGLGYFLFGHISMRVNMENMQARTTKVICSPVCPDEERGAFSTLVSGGGHGDQLAPSTSAGHSSTLHHSPDHHQHSHHYPSYQSTNGSGGSEDDSSVGPIITDSSRL